MDFADGGSLDVLLANCPLPECIAAHIVKELLFALGALHKANFIHRDIKAANVLVTSSGEVYLSDFGTTRQIAKSIDTISGSPYWMAPEICKLQFDTSSPAYDCKADMWSLGVTAIELVTGKPFTTVTNDLGSRGVHYIMLKVSSCQDTTVPPESVENFQLSEAFEDFVQLCLKVCPSARSSAPELLRHRWVEQAASGHEMLKKLVRAQSIESVDLSS
eukprot:Filipodium_phascolosomae@DN2428_c0_g1_i5.p1